MSVPQAIDLRRRLMSPANAVEDRPINLRPGNSVAFAQVVAPAIVREKRKPTHPQTVDTRETFLANGRHMGLAILRGRAPQPAPTIQMGRGISVALILHFTSKEFKLSPDDILSKSRTREIVTPRQVVAYLARTMARMSLPIIGRRLGGKDHSTIISNVRRIQRRIDADEDFARRVYSIRREVLECAE